MSVPCPKCGQKMGEGIACPGAKPILICLSRPKRTPEQLEKQVTGRMETCVHYGPRPGMVITCAAGIPEHEIPRRPLPCVTDKPCPKKRLPTREEVRERIEARDAEVNGCGHMLVGDEAIAYYRQVKGAQVVAQSGDAGEG